MTTPLLSTKFFIPQPRKATVRRQRLHDSLANSVQYRLILVSAPAGYGKTTLITSWLHELMLPVAWFSVEAGDNDFYRFFLYFLEAINQKESRVGQTLLQIIRAMPPSQENLANLVLNELTHLTGDLFLVIDDYHLIENPATHKALSQIISNAPREMHFVICSRTDLPFSVSKLRASGEMLEITQADLRLTVEESEAYMNSIMEAGLERPDIILLQDRTEGWLVGMQMAALSLRGVADRSGFIASLKGDNRLIADYLVDEVLLLLPDELQNFLLCTSLLDRMQASLCNAVLQIENSQEMLESIDRRRLFITPLDDVRHWFRYHHLFREMLFDRLMHKHPEKLADLYRRSATWHAANDMKDRAVEYALKAGDYELVMALLGEIGLARVSSGGWDQVLDWFSRIPYEIFLAHPDLWVVYFIALINQGSIPEVGRKLEQIDQHSLESLGLAPEELKRIRGELGIVRGVYMIHSGEDSSLSKKALHEALQLLAGDATFRRAFVTFNYGVSCFQLGENAEAQQMFQETISLANKIGFSLAKLIGTSYLAETHARIGNLRLAHEIFQEATRYAHEAGLQEGAVFSKTKLGMGSLLYEWNQLDEALRSTMEGIRLAEMGGYLNQLLPGYASLTRIQYLQGDHAGMDETIQRARKMAAAYGDPLEAVAFINAIQAESAFRRGELFYTGNWLNTLKKKTLENVNLYSQYELQTFVRLLAAREEAVNIRELIRPGWDAAMRQGRGRDAIACEVVLAKSLYIRGEPLPAMKILERALFKAEPGHFVRTFLDEGGVLISMIKQVLASRSNKKLNPDDCSQQYLYLLLDEMAKDALKASTNHPQPGAVGLEPLTDHELRILRLLESGYSNKQIAGELSISVNTVKYHLKNIYGKLGVVNRTQASRLMRKEK